MSLCYRSSYQLRKQYLCTAGAELLKKMGDHMQYDTAFECVIDFIYNTNIFNFNFIILTGMHGMLPILLL